MNPINQRRWQLFKSNRRGYFSFWIFLFLFFTTLFAEWIANDKPILVIYQNQWYYPIWNDYLETTFGGDLEITTDYRDTFISDKIEQSGNIFWPMIPYSYATINYALDVPSPSPPTSENWLGTDDQGRDVLARVIYGFRISILFSLFLSFFSSIVGIFLGAVQGYYGGMIDLFMQRFIEIWDGLPQLFILIIIASIVKPSFWVLLLIIIAFSWSGLVSVVRAEILRVRNFEYVRAARALGVDNFTIIRRHILPNAMVATLTFLPFIISGGVVTLTALDFLGFGLPPGTASLGELLRQGKDNLQAPWLGMTAFLVLAILLTLLVFIGEAIRDAFDPRKTLSY